MRFGKVDFPEELITAHSKGELVIFAGAGVSMDPPSNLPDSEGLANRIAEKAGIERGSKPIDEFLGDLKRQKIEVHEIAKKFSPTQNLNQKLPTAIFYEFLATLPMSDW